MSCLLIPSGSSGGTSAPPLTVVGTVFFFSSFFSAAAAAADAEEEEEEEDEEELAGAEGFLGTAAAGLLAAGAEAPFWPCPWASGFFAASGIGFFFAAGSAEEAEDSAGTGSGFLDAAAGNSFAGGAAPADDEDEEEEEEEEACADLFAGRALFLSAAEALGLAGAFDDGAASCGELMTTAAGFTTGGRWSAGGRFDGARNAAGAAGGRLEEEEEEEEEDDEEELAAGSANAFVFIRISRGPFACASASFPVARSPDRDMPSALAGPGFEASCSNTGSGSRSITADGSKDSSSLVNIACMFH